MSILFVLRRTRLDSTERRTPSREKSHSRRQSPGTTNISESSSAGGTGGTRRRPTFVEITYSPRGWLASPVPMRLSERPSP